MASIVKRGKFWRVQVARAGVRRSATFNTKAQAEAWAVQTENDILSGTRGEVPRKTFGALLERYRDEVSATKRGERWERARIGLLLRDAVAGVMLPELNATHFAAWRDRRLKQVSAASVLREWNLLSHACTVAVKEWRWLRENPMKSVRRPAHPPARERRIGADEIERLLFALGYDHTGLPITATARVGAALLFAIETAMRAGEMCGLTRDRIDLDARVATLPLTKNGSARKVPLSAEAVRIARQAMAAHDGEQVFGISTPQLDALFRKAKNRAMIDNLHFHDSRAEALTRMSKKVDVLTLARISGHRDLKMLMVYYRESAEDIAKKLD